MNESAFTDFLGTYLTSPAGLVAASVVLITQLTKQLPWFNTRFRTFGLSAAVALALTAVAMLLGLMPVDQDHRVVVNLLVNVVINVVVAQAVWATVRSAPEIPTPKPPTAVLLLAVGVSLVLLTACASVPARNVKNYNQLTARPAIEHWTENMPEPDRSIHRRHFNAVERASNAALDLPEDDGLLPE